MTRHPMTGLEVWLLGTPAEVAAVVAALTRAGCVLYTGPAHILHGGDTGRIRRYLRLSVAIPARATRAPASDPGLFAA